MHKGSTFSTPSAPNHPSRSRMRDRGRGPSSTLGTSARRLAAHQRPRPLTRTHPSTRVRATARRHRPTLLKRQPRAADCARPCGARFCRRSLRHRTAVSAPRKRLRRRLRPEFRHAVAGSLISRRNSPPPPFGLQNLVRPCALSPQGVPCLEDELLGPWGEPGARVRSQEDSCATRS